MTMEKKWLKVALWLAAATIGYNIAEGMVSVFFGMEDNTLALLGFGVDSFVEVVSALGILHLIVRMRKHGFVEQRDKFEMNALRITGFAFYLLTAGLLAGSTLKLVQDYKPDTTVAGIIIFSLSILTMYFLMHYKLKTGKNLTRMQLLPMPIALARVFICLLYCWFPVFPMNCWRSLIWMWQVPWELHGLLSRKDESLLKRHDKKR